jgi:hypothetical protein
MAEHEHFKPDDSFKLAVKEEVAKVFHDPPASLTERIEKEVRERIAIKEKHYRTIILLVGGLSGLGLSIWFRNSIDNVRATVESTLATNEIVRIKQDITNALIQVQEEAGQVSNICEQVARQDRDDKVLFKRLTSLRDQSAKEGEFFKEDKEIAMNRLQDIAGVQYAISNLNESAKSQYQDFTNWMESVKQSIPK